jgi:hypothetical protein
MMMDADECGTIRGILGRRTEVLGENLLQCCLDHHKSKTI